METSQTLENNKKIARQSLESFEKKDISLLDKITDQSKYKMHFPGKPEALNYEETKNLNLEYYTAFPDAKVTINFQVAEGDYVVSYITYNGTQKGILQGISPSNKKVTTTGIAIVRISNGKITEEWNEFDAMGMMQQIGAIPETMEQQNR